VVQIAIPKISREAAFMKTTLLVFALVCSVSSSSFAFDFAPFNLPGAPALGSPEDQSDYEQVLQYQTVRTTADCARATSEESITLATFYGAPYGPLTADEVTHWSAFVNGLYMTAQIPIGLAKAQWKRPRPFKSHSDIHPCIKLEPSYSYPSGHSAISEFYARVLSVAFPDRATAFKTRALQIALDRSVGGVHYPSDIRDGNLMGDQIYDSENQNGALEKRIHAQP
jgi:acid phosphatase (class A)